MGIKRRGGGHGGGGGHDSAGGLRWLLTYADMITLLLALFIYLYSISEINSAKFSAFSTAFSEAFGFSKTPIVNETSGTSGVLPMQGFPEGKVKPYGNQPPAGDGRQPGYKEGATPEAEQSLQQLKYQLEIEFPDWIKQGDLTILEPDEGLMLRLRDNAVFRLGRAEITTEAEAVLSALAQKLQMLDFPLRVEGHTDDLPIGKNSPFASNWELSGARAASVVRDFIGRGIAPNRLSLAGYAEYRPIQTNIPGQGNPVNRRVEILIVAPRKKPAVQGGQEITITPPPPAEQMPPDARQPAVPESPAPPAAPVPEDAFPRTEMQHDAAQLPQSSEHQ